MLKRNVIEAVLMEMSRQEGTELSKRDQLIMRTHVAQALDAKARFRQRMNAKPYQWKKPDKLRR